MSKKPMLKACVMTGKESQRRAELSARRIMDQLIDKLVEYRQKNGLRNIHIEAKFGFSNAHLKKIIEKERCYIKPELITVLQLIYGLELNYADFKDIFDTIGLHHPRPDATIQLPDSFSRLKEREKHLLLRIINDFVDSHTLPERHIKTAQNHDK